MCVDPILTFAIPAWAKVSPNQDNKLQVIQNKGIRSALDASWYIRNTELHRKANISSIRQLIKDLLIKYHQRTKNHPNPLLRTAIDYDEEIHYRIKNPKTALHVEVDWRPTTTRRKVRRPARRPKVS